MAVTETWLTDACSSSFISIPSFSLFRGDVTGTIRKHGAAIYVRSDIKHVQIEVSLPNLSVLHLIDFDIYVVSVYRPPSYENSENQALIVFISQFVVGKEVLIMGDFNLPSLNWAANSVYSDYVNPNDRLFYNCFLECGLTQWVKFGTFVPSGNILDLVFTTDDDRIGDVYSAPPFPKCHHCPVICTVIFDFSEQAEEDYPDERKCWARANFGAISNDIVAVDWEACFAGLDVQAAYTFFIDVVLTSVHINVPARRAPKQGKWLTVPPRAMTRERKLQWQSYQSARRIYGRQSTEAVMEMQEFNRLNHFYRNYSVYRQCNYEQKLVDLIPEAPKLFHAYLRERKKGCPTVGPLKDSNGNLAHCRGEMAEMLAVAFSSVYVPTDPINPHPFQHTEESMGNLVVTYDAVRNILNGLSASSSSGPDGIHPSVLLRCSDAMALPLALIIDMSLQNGALPREWKQSRVVPIFKSGSKFVPRNYRPVSVTSSPCKVTERLVVDHILDYLDQHRLLSNKQFGFRRGRSTEDQLLLTYGKIATEVDRGMAVDVAYLDFSTAFDILSHRVLIAKLQALGFCAQIVGWIRAFLEDRYMSVSVGGSHSEPKRVLSGVPQGSVLGPLLFIIYVNSLGFEFNCDWYAFADDLKLFAALSRSDGGEPSNILQDDLDKLYAISNSWNLKLNPAKCVVMKFGTGLNIVDGSASGYVMGGNSLKNVKVHKDLGVLVDSSLRFHPHVAAVVKKASSLSNQILRGTLCRTPQFMVTLFISHVRPILDYCSPVWNQAYLGDLRSLESVQRRWTSEISGLSGLTYPARLRALKLFSIRGRLFRMDLIKLWKIFHMQCSEELSSLFEREFHVATRGHAFKLSVPRCHTDKLRRFFSVRVVQDWNSLPPGVVEVATLYTFKARLDKHMGVRFYETFD